MLLYCVGQNAFIKQLKTTYPRLIAYADDILIFHDSDVDATKIIEHATDVARHYGLAINIDNARAPRGDKLYPSRCPISREKQSIAKATANALEHLKLVMGASISHHTKLTLVRISVISMVTSPTSRDGFTT